ncbi:MAG TPA: von Willebrand factor type A domain-containing protein [Caulobacteraceae bacterium]|jgi:Ca-activated chloride channel family protein
MARIKSLASKAITTLSAVSLTASTWAGAPVLAAPRVLDGTPTAQACAPFGYTLTGGDDDDSYQGRAHYAPSPAMRVQPRVSASPAMMAPPPPPPPPPPPITAMAGATSSNSVSEVVVSGARIQSPSPQMTIVGGYNGKLQPPAGAIDTERYPHAPINGVHETQADPVSTFSIDVDTTSYSNVRRFLNDGMLPPHDSVRVEELVNYFRYDYPLPASKTEPFKPFVAVAPSPWSKGKEIVDIAIQGYDLNRDQRPPLNLVFLVDTSGSMMTPDRLPLARQALNVLIDQLRPQDHVALVAYAGSVGEVMAPTSGDQKLKMRCALASLEAGGSTAGGAGLALAYKVARESYRVGAANRVILMTDGDFNVGVADPSKLQDFVAEQRKTGVYLSAYGYGRGNYNDAMMQTLAQNGNGTAGYVDSLDEAKRLFREDFSSSVFPIADDVKIQVEFNPARVSEYRLIGYETRMLNREDFNNDKVDAGEVGSGASVTALYEITPVGGPSSVDPLRYQPAAAGAKDQGDELAYLKVRYKLPGEQISHLITRPITAADAVTDLDRAPESTRWALAVAAYGQKLRGDPWLGDGFGWDRIADLAEHSGGGDAYGLKAQFVTLVKKAGAAKSINEADAD